VAENNLLTVNVTVADPDGDPLSSLTATGVPAGATFTPGPGNTSGTLSWTPDFTKAGSYSVTFTASNALLGSGTTAVTVTNTGPRPGGHGAGHRHRRGERAPDRERHRG
jgi:hypothetical protein